MLLLQLHWRRGDGTTEGRWHRQGASHHGHHPRNIDRGHDAGRHHPRKVHRGENSRRDGIHRRQRAVGIDPDAVLEVLSVVAGAMVVEGAGWRRGRMHEHVWTLMSPPPRVLRVHLHPIHLLQLLDLNQFWVIPSLLILVLHLRRLMMVVVLVLLLLVAVVLLLLLLLLLRL